jgi:uncharacterized membrane protein YcaP (DUF421 family)
MNDKAPPPEDPGEPIVLIEDGRLVEPNLRRRRLTREEIGAEARLEGISSLADVRWAILETNGRISFVTRAADR